MPHGKPGLPSPMANSRSQFVCEGRDLHVWHPCGASSNCNVVQCTAGHAGAGPAPAVAGAAFVNPETNPNPNSNLKRNLRRRTCGCRCRTRGGGSDPS